MAFNIFVEASVQNRGKVTRSLMVEVDDTIAELKQKVQLLFPELDVINTYAVGNGQKKIWPRQPSDEIITTISSLGLHDATILYVITKLLGGVPPNMIQDKQGIKKPNTTGNSTSGTTNTPTTQSPSNASTTQQPSIRQ